MGGEPVGMGAATGTGAAIVAVAPGVVFRRALLVIAALEAAYLLTQGGRLALGWGGRAFLDLAYFVDLNQENNLPSWYAAGQLLACALLCAALAARRPAGAGERGAWRGGALVAAALALDEATALHERTSALANALLGADRLGYYVWVAPAALLAAAVALRYRRFVLALPRPVRRLLALAAALYVGAALGLELAEWAIERATGAPETAWLVLPIAAEEGLELAAVALAGYALLAHLAGPGGAVGLCAAGTGGPHDDPAA